MASYLRHAFRRRGLRMGWCALGLVIIHLHAVWAQQVLDGIAAIVNDSIITISEVREVVALEAADLDNRYYGTELEMRRRELFRKALQPLIDVEIQLERAKTLQITVQESEVDRQVDRLKEDNQLTDAQLEEILQSRGLTLEAHREQISRSLLLTKIVNFEVQSRLVITEAELQEAYEQRQDRFRIADEWTVRHIVFLASEQATAEEDTQARQKAEAILQQLRAGGDFAQLARQHSEGPSAEKDGLLGTFRTGELVAGLEEVVVSLQPGEISDLVRTQIGWHIVQLDNAQVGGHQPLEAVREELSLELKRAKFERNYEEWLESLRQQSYIKILYEG
ncbi:peptidylprolyl isomerase [Candidatus Entotheonella palauensis]|uniref:peptidylprolyl isomerase n=1 Tax=Candidatus Entotheonella palauensis TaxID=93172 RepID=UPI000B7D3FFA|nr:peptidylprolyl isomerase [Candidatus Entotheonella palauensis]